MEQEGTEDTDVTEVVDESIEVDVTEHQGDVPDVREFDQRRHDSHANIASIQCCMFLHVNCMFACSFT